MSDNPSAKSCVNRSSPSVKEQCNASVSQPQQHHQPSAELAAPAFEIEEKLNDLYEKRLAEINEQANGDASLKEITYKEWITMLRQINTTLITNIQEIDCETTKRLALLQRKSSGNCRHDQVIELCKYRKDIDSLVHLIRNGRQNGDWSVDGLSFETISEQDIFGETSCCEINSKKESQPEKKSIPTDPKSCAVQKSKLMAHVKALAFEIAERHDEMRDLKRQIISLEDGILNAQKKIQLKDDVIRELRNDLKTFPKCPATWGRRSSERLSPNDCYLPMSEAKLNELCDIDSPDTPRVDSYKNRDSINSINLSEFSLSIREEDDEEELIKCLKEELVQFFEAQETYDQNVGDQKRALQNFQSRINELVDKLIKTNNDQQIKLRFLRRELLNLENPQSNRTITDKDSGISTEVDSDARIVNMVRSRMSDLADENRKLQTQEQRLQIENEDLNSQLKGKSILLDKTSKALREVADTLSIALCKPIQYDDIFEQTSNMTTNPIVDAFSELLEALTERDKKILELRQQIGNSGRTNLELEEKSENLRAELCELKKSMSTYGQYENRGKLFQNQEFSRILIEKAEEHHDERLDTPQGNRNEYLRIIDDLSSDLNTLSCQVNMVQSEFLNDEAAERFEGSLKGLEAQNDLLQAAIDSLIEEKGTIERTLKTKNEDLKNKVCCLEKQIWKLQNDMFELERKPCERCKNNANFENEQQVLRHRTQRTSLDEKCEQLESELKGQCRRVETLKSENVELKRELSEIRRSQAKTKLLQRREATPERGSNQKELLSKLNAAQEANCEQSKSLRKASKQISCLQSEIEEFRVNEEVFRRERDLLQSELTALKEYQASQLGVQQSLKEQLHRTTNELYVAKKELSQCNQEKDDLENNYRNETNRFRKTMNEMLSKHNNLVEQFNEVVQEYQKLVQIEQEKSKIIAAFEAWKEEQIQIENEMRQKTELFENHLKQTIEDRQNLLDQLNQTKIDNQILSHTLENSRLNSSSGTASGSTRGYKTMTASFTGDPVSKVIESVRHTSRKLLQQRSTIEEEAYNFPK